jgi:uncharacterized protein YjiS (DUF1127 family)
VKGLWRWLSRAREDAEIAGLTVRELRDIGLDRYSLRR